MTILIKKYRFVLFFLLPFFASQKLTAQQLNIPLNNELNYRIESNFYSDNNFFSGIKPYKIQKNFIDSLNSLSLIKTDEKFLDYLLNKNVFEYGKGNFSIDANPLITLMPEYSSETKTFLSNYRFGLNIGAYIGKKLSVNFTGFYGITSFDNYWQGFVDSTNVLPHYGEYIAHNGSNYGFWSLNGYLSYQPIKYFNFEVGKGKNFFGEGYRSLFLSDNSNSSPYFKTTVDIWHFRYVWLIGFLKDENTNIPNVWKNKLQFTHFLSWNATKWLNFNFFESIISNPVDSLGITYLNFNYLNPVIFYRPVEFMGGSADNALMGAGLTFKLWKKYYFYSQFLIDEFVISEIKAGNGWWGNKFGIQAGLKFFDLFNVKNLMILGEINIIRPYTYSYSNSILNYGNYKQPLAHPSGANLKEAVFIAHYNKKRFSVQFKTVYQTSGLDTAEISFGKDIYKPYTQRSDDYGHSIAQGLETNYWSAEVKTAWMVNFVNNTQIQLTISTYQIDNRKYCYDNFLISFGIKTLIFNESTDIIY